ncbi:MAG: hypothetical protein RBS48_05965 [Ignavibacteriaceae bacterium]|jgi:hypothetical protein|nr:hypothetical protein [Ignavibacteriaceae bacterium]
MNWKHINIPDIQASFSSIKLDDAGNILIGGYDLIDHREVLWYYDQKNLKEITSTNSTTSSITVMQGISYVMINKKLSLFKKGNLTELLDFTYLNGFVGGIWGRSINDCFILTDEGISHYNGTDLKLIYPTSLWIRSFLIFNNGIMVLMRNHESGEIIILKGELMGEINNNIIN